jgi:hypothetical protein
MVRPEVVRRKLLLDGYLRELAPTVADARRG